jgi:hypothetical protein
MPANKSPLPVSADCVEDKFIVPEFDASAAEGGVRQERLELCSFVKRYVLYLQRSESCHECENK